MKTFLMTTLGRGVVAVALACAALGASAADWTTTLAPRLAEIDAGFAGELGVYVYEPDSGRAVSWQAAQPWYLASGIKLFVAIATLRAIDAGEFTLDATVVLGRNDYVDGAGATNSHRPGTALSIRYLLEQMIVASDNTASDLLIRQAGLDRVNAVAREWLPDGGPITTLADVRRLTYSGFHPSAGTLASADLLALRKHRGDARVNALAERLGIPRSRFQLATLDAAFDAYYATGANSGSLVAYGRMLAALHNGELLDAGGTTHLLDLMRNVRTGARRLRAALPRNARLAHKTGTQHRRACDLGVVEHHGRALVVAACVRGEARLASSERVLREVAAAVAGSGALAGPDMLQTAP